MSIKYRSGNFTIAQPVGILHNESPLLPEINDVLIFHQDYMQDMQYFNPLPYNSPNPDLNGDTAYLFDESPRSDLGGRIVRWTRSWARIPPTYGKAGGTYPFTFPAFDTGNNDIRSQSLKKAVALEIVRDFFLCGDGGLYASWQQIPIIKAFQPYDINSDDLTDTSSFTDSLRDASGDDPGTSPSLTEYKALIAAGSFINTEDSKVTNWRGGIYMREQYQIVAQ